MVLEEELHWITFLTDLSLAEDLLVNNLTVMGTLEKNRLRIPKKL